MSKTIRDSQMYDAFPCKFNMIITIDEHGNKTTSPKPKNWEKIKTDQVSSTSPNMALLSGKPNKFTCIDLDLPKNDDEIDGIKWFETNIGKISELNTLVIKSIRGGYHIYYKYDKTMKTAAKVLKFNKKITVDIRNDGGMIWEGRGYELINDVSELADVPPIFLDYLKSDKVLKNLEAKNYQVPENTNCIDTMLSSLLPEYYNDYDSWRNIGMIIKNMGLGVEFFHKFSRQSEKYDELETEQFFQKLCTVQKGTEKYIGLGSLLYYYKCSRGETNYKKMIKEINFTPKKQAGALVSNDEWSGVPDTQFLKAKALYLVSQIYKEDDTGTKIIDKYARQEYMDYMNKFFALVEQPECYYYKKYIDSNNFRLLTSLKHIIPDFPTASEWKKLDDCITYDGIEFTIKESGVNPLNLNSYRRPPTNKNFDGKLEDIAPTFVTYLKMIGDNTDKGYIFIMNYLAKMIQNGFTGIAIILLGNMGAGKSTFPDLVGVLVGMEYYKRIPDVNQLGFNFNADMENKNMTVVEEVATDAGGYHRINNIIKTLTTDQHKVRIEKKGIDPYSITSQNNLVFITNGINPIHITSDNRRNYLTEVPDTYIGNVEFFKKLRQEVNDNIENIRGFFYNYDYIHDLNSIRPTTTAEKAVLELNRHSLYLFIRDTIQSLIASNDYIIGKGIHIENFTSAYSDYCMTKGLKATRGERYIKEELKKYKWNTYGNVVFALNEKQFVPSDKIVFLPHTVEEFNKPKKYTKKIINEISESEPDSDSSCGLQN